jgi:hypothetical protein
VSDERLRELERAAAAGDAEAGAEALRLRLRLGLLDEERLALGAYLGDPVAGALRPDMARLGEADWPNGLERFDRWATVAALVALSEGSAPEAAPPHADCLAAVKAWLATPNDAYARAVAEKGEALWAAKGSRTLVSAALAVLAHPPKLAARGLDVGAAREVVRDALLPRVLRDPGPLATPPPPSDVARFGSTFHHAASAWFAPLEAEAGLRVAEILHPWLWGSVVLLGWRPDGPTERVTVVNLRSARPGGFEATRLLMARCQLLGGERRSTPLALAPLGEDHYALRESHLPGEPLLAWRERTSPSPAQAAAMLVGLARLVGPLRAAVDDLRLRPEHAWVSAEGRPLLQGWCSAGAEQIAQAHYESPHAIITTAEDLRRLRYTPPEELHGRPPVFDALAVYRLGTLGYELLSGSPAFVGDNASALLRAMVHGTPPPPSSLAPELPPWVDAPILRAMAPEPSERFPTPEAFADTLEEALAGD